jgi:hypothetical protein
MSPPVNPQFIANRPTYDMPANHAGNAPSAAVNIHRIAATKHNDFSFASSSLTTALLASIGEANKDTLRTTFPDLAPYMLTPRQIVDTVLATALVSMV